MEDRPMGGETSPEVIALQAPQITALALAIRDYSVRLAESLLVLAATGVAALGVMRGLGYLQQRMRHAREADSLFLK